MQCMTTIEGSLEQLCRITHSYHSGTPMHWRVTMRFMGSRHQSLHFSHLHLPSFVLTLSPALPVRDAAAPAVRAPALASRVQIRFHRVHEHPELPRRAPTLVTGRRGAKVYESTTLSSCRLWTIPRNEIQMEMENAVGEGSEREGIVYKGIWRMMPVAAFVRSAPSALRFAPWPALISTS